MTEDEALDGLAAAICDRRLTGMDRYREAAHFYRDHAGAAVEHLRANPDVARTLGIGGTYGWYRDARGWAYRKCPDWDGCWALGGVHGSHSLYAPEDAPVGELTPYIIGGDES